MFVVAIERGSMVAVGRAYTPGLPGTKCSDNCNDAVKGYDHKLAEGPGKPVFQLHRSWPVSLANEMVMFGGGDIPDFDPKDMSVCKSEEVRNRADIMFTDQQPCCEPQS